MPSSFAPATEKENADATADTMAKPVRRGVGPRSGTKKVGNFPPSGAAFLAARSPGQGSPAPVPSSAYKAWPKGKQLRRPVDIAVLSPRDLASNTCSSSPTAKKTSTHPEPVGAVRALAGKTMEDKSQKHRHNDQQQQCATPVDALSAPSPLRRSSRNSIGTSGGDRTRRSLAVEDGKVQAGQASVKNLRSSGKSRPTRTSKSVGETVVPRPHLTLQRQSDFNIEREDPVPEGGDSDTRARASSTSSRTALGRSKRTSRRQASAAAASTGGSSSATQASRNTFKPKGKSKVTRRSRQVEEPIVPPPDVLLQRQSDFDFELEESIPDDGDGDNRAGASPISSTTAVGRSKSTRHRQVVPPAAPAARGARGGRGHTNRVSKNTLNSEGKNRQTRTRKPAGRSVIPLSDLPVQGRSDFDFELEDSATDEDLGIVGDNRAGPSSTPTKAALGRSKGKSRRQPTPTAGGQRTRAPRCGGKSGGTLRRVERTPVPLCVGRVPGEEPVGDPSPTVVAGGPACQMGSVVKETKNSNAQRRSAACVPASDEKKMSPYSTSVGGGSVGALSPRGSWHLGTLFGESDDDVQELAGKVGGCNWRLSDDESEEGDGLPKKRRQRRPAGRGASSSRRKKSRANEGGGSESGGGHGEDLGRSKGRLFAAGGDSGDFSRQERVGHAKVNGLADGLSPLDVVDANGRSGKSSSEGLNRQGNVDDHDEAELEAIRARFRKVDSHQLNLSR